MPPVPSAAEPIRDLTKPAIGIVALAVLVGMPGTVLWCLFPLGAFV